MFDINDRNKMFAYVPSKSDLTVDNINLYSNSLIFIGDENQIYQPLTNTYIGIGLTAYNNLSNDVKAKIDKLYIYNQLNDDNIYYFPVLKTPSTGSFYYTYTSNRIGFNPHKQLFIGNLSGTSYTSSYSYIYPNSNDKNLPLIFADVTNNINNTIYKGAGNFIFYNPAKGSFGLGNNIVASGNYSTSQGINNMSYGDYSHVGGSQSISYGESSFVHGTGLLVGSYSNVVAFGKWNDARHEDSVFMIGNGVDNENRSNLFEIRDNGCAYAETFVGNLNGRARWADYATYSTYTTYTTYALYNSYQSVHNISLNKNYYITFSEHSTYSLSYIDTDFYYNPYTNVLNSPKFSGNLTGDVTGNLTGNVTGNLTGNVTGNLTGDVTGNVTGNLTGDVTGNVSGNAGTATKLQTARKINGTSFDGTADITIKPKVLIEGKQTAVQVGNQTSPYIVLAYSQTADLADRATKLNTSRTINGTSFDGTANITIAPTLPINGNTVAVKVGNQQSSYVTIPYATNSDLAAKATKLETSRKINGTSFDGTADITIKPKVLLEGKQVAVQVGNQTSDYITISYSYTADLATRATQLDNARTFNGESFNGTANVTMTTSLPISGNTISVKVGNQQSSFITVPYATNSNLAAKATKLETSRKINGTSFDGTADINIKPKVLIEGKQLGVQVGNQTSDYITVSYSYTADLATRATQLNNSRTFNGESFNGTANVTMATSLPISGNTVAVKVGNQTSPYITIPYATNSNLAAKATKLETSRKINGTLFDGSADITIAPKLLIEGKQVAVKVGNQTSPYIAISYSYTSDLASRATKLDNSRTFNGESFNGTANVTMATSLPISGNTIAVKVGNQTSQYITVPYATTSANTTGNAATATKLQTARKINGTSFDGTADITIAPKLLIEGKQTAVQVGNQTSPYITISYSHTADLASRATKLNNSRTFNGESFDGTANVTMATSLPISGNTIAVKVGNQQSSFITVPYATNSNLAAKATKLETSRKINGTSFDGSADITIAPKLLIEGKQVAVKVGNQTSPYIAISYSHTADLASRATKLDNSRTFNGESFNGTANVTMATSLPISGNTIAVKVGNQTSQYITVPYATTSANTTGNAATATKWQTARTLTIGSKGKSVDGSANVSWTLDEIGVYSKTTSDSRFVNATGDTMTGTLTLKGSTSENMTFANNVHPALRFDNSDSSQNVAFIFTDTDTYRSPAGIKLIGNQGSEWFEAAGEMYAAGGKKVLHAGNYTDYTVTKTGSGASGSWGISITGNAATATKWQTTRTFTIGATGKSVDGGANVTWTLAEIISSSAIGSVAVPIYWTGSKFATVQATFGNSSYGEHNANNIKSNGMWYYSSNGPATSIGASTTDGALYSQAYSTSWAGQIAQDYRNGGLYVRGLNNGTWQSWYTVLDSRNYTTYTVKKDGTGASGTWGINISGNAATATSASSAAKWTTARTLTIGATGKSVDGSANVSWTLDEIGVYSKTTSDSRFVNATGDTMTGALTIKGVADTGQYSQGGFNKAYANIMLQGDNTYGVSGIVFKSMKANGTNINTPSDVAFIQYHPMGVTAAAYNTTPTQASSGEKSRLVIGIGNDTGDSAGEELWLQTPGANDLKHYVVNTGYIILDANNYTNYTVTKTGSGASGSWGISITGNAATATKWQTARTLTIGSKGKSVDGSANVSWSLDEIGVYSKTASDDRYVNVTGDTMTGSLYIKYEQDVGLNKNGSLIIGNKDGENLAFDSNEIMARNNGAAATLYLNADGGTVCLNSGGGNTGIGTASPSYKLHVAGDMYTTGYARAASGFVKGSSSDSYVLLGGGGHKEWSDGYKVSTIVARNSSGQIYCSHLNTTSNDMNSTGFTKVFVSNDSWVRYVTKAKFMEAVNGYDTVSITKSLKVTEAWMDTGIVMSTANFPRGSGTYAIKISHANLNTPGSNGYASIYSGVMSIYTDGTNSTTDCEEVILHRAGHAWANRIYIRTMPVASSGNCKLQIATSKTWTTASNITFTFRKLV